MDRRLFLKTAAGAYAGSHMAGLQMAHAETYPGAMTVRLVVPFTPAGATDIVGRAVADGLGTYWNTSTVVDNVPGVGGNIGMDKVAKGPTDGSQILIAPTGLCINQYLYASMPFSPDTDIVPVSLVTQLTNLLCVRKGLPVKSVADLIAYGKANPGKLNFASSGVGTTIHLSAELFKKMAGIDMVHVVYKGSAPAINDLIAGNVDLMFDNLPSIGVQAKAGNVVGLAVTSAQKSPFAPEYPTVAETLPGYDVQGWFGVAVRAGTPQPVIDALEAGVIAVCKSEATRTRLAAGSFQVVGSTRQQFTDFTIAERKRWGALIGELKIKVQ